MQISLTQDPSHSSVAKIGLRGLLAALALLTISSAVLAGDALKVQGTAMATTATDTLLSRSASNRVTAMGMGTAPSGTGMLPALATDTGMDTVTGTASPLDRMPQRTCVVSSSQRESHVGRKSAASVSLGAIGRTMRPASRSNVRTAVRWFPALG